MGARICIVEDEGIVAHDIKTHLEIAGHEVAGIFSSGEELLSRIESVKPDLILMDIKLRGSLDGVETASLIRSRYKIPVVILTAFADEKTIQRAKETEPFGYILKPFEERELNTAVEMALYRYSLEKRLQESEERYRRFFEEDLSGDFFALPDGRIIECNSAFLEIFNFPNRASALESNLNDLLPSQEDRNRFWENLKTKRKLHLTETEFVSTKKRQVAILANVIGSFNLEGELTMVKGYLIDMSERRELEKQLRQSQKMEAVGRLAGGVAHDFNNILTVILGYNSLIEEKIREGISIESDIEGIGKAARKATALTRQLLAFSRRQVLNPTVLDINSLVRDMEKMVRRILVKDIVMILRPGEDIPRVFVDPGQIEQVLMNLVVNAKDAMPEGGKLLVATRKEYVPAQKSSVMGEIPEGLYAVLQITDTGIGISEEDMPQVFEPFFTTKSVDKGTGLGLSTVYGIVKQSGGYICVDSLLGKGTTFTIYLPATEQIPENRKQEKETLFALVGSETVLIVEDEEDVRAVISLLLARYGYTVLEANNPGEALLICETHERPIEVLISDIIMKHMSGIRLAERLRKIKPELRVLLLSGYPDETIRDKVAQIPNTLFLAKPLEPLTLLSSLRQILEAGGEKERK